MLTTPSTAQLRHLPVGAGAELRSVQAILQGLPVSVFDFIPVAEQDAIVAGTSVYDCTADIQAAINALGLAGGGTLVFPRGVFTISATLVVAYSNVYLTGAGQGYLQASQAAIRASAATRVAWNAAVVPVAGTPMVDFKPPTTGQGLVGGGMRGIMLDGNTVCPVGLRHRSWRGAHFEQLFVYATATDGYLFGVVNYALASGVSDCQHNTFINCFHSAFGGSGWYLDNLSRGFRLTGGTAPNTGNTCFNTFINCESYTSKGDPWVLENCDSNVFIDAAGGQSRAGGSGYAHILCSSDQDSGNQAQPARFNTFMGRCGAVWSRSSQLSGESAHHNTVLALSFANSGAAPTIEPVSAGAALLSTINYMTSGKYGTPASLALEGVKVLGTRDTGWTAPTGVAGNKGVFVAAVAGTASVGYVQAEMQAALNRIAAAEARIKALDEANRGHGLTGT